jgi:aspartate racemase
VKTLGLVGGIGPESTIDYYRQIIADYQERIGTDASPSMLIDSLDAQVLLRHFNANRLADVIEVFVASVERLARGGATFGAIAANTPHLVFGDVKRRSPIPLVSIVEATCREAHARGLKRVALLGTGFTMRGRFYPEVFEAAGIAMVTPEGADLEYVHQKYITELLKNQFLPDTRDDLAALIDRLRKQQGIEAVVLAGTELPLVLRGAATSVPMLDTSRIHVEAIVEELVEG